MTGPFSVPCIWGDQESDSSESEMKADHWLNVMAPTTDGRRLPRAVRETLALRSCTSHVLGRTASAVSSTHR